MIFLPSAKFLYRPQTTIPVPVANVYWEADYGVVTTTNGTTADASPVSGNKVLSWTSKGGTNKVLTNSTNANRPTYIVPAYGVPYVTFDSTVNFQWLAGNNIANVFDNNQSMSMGVALRRPGAYNSSRNEPYILFNPGWNGTNKLEQNGGVLRYTSGGDAIGDIPGTWITTSATRDVTAETTIFGTFSTTSTAQTAANAAASTGKIYLNGTLNNTSTGNATKTGVGYNGNYTFAVGGPAGSGVAGPSARDYYGVYLYTSELTAVQVSAAHTDISSRYFGWSALPVASPALWLDASRSDTLFTDIALTTAVTTDNGPVGRWRDLSGNNRHALQSGTNRPTWRTPINGQNGLGVMSFNGSTQWTMSPLATATPYTQFVVAKIKDNTRINRILHGGNSAQDGRYLLGSSGGNYAIYLSAVNPTWTGGALPLPPATSIYNMWKNLSVTNTGTSTGLQPYVTNTALSTGNGTLATFSNMTIGYGPSSQYANMDLAEVIQYDFVLNATQLASVNAYLSAKWGT